MHPNMISLIGEDKRQVKREFVYLLTSPWVPEGIHKIGRTTDPDGRLAIHRCSLPNARYARLIRIENAVEGEKLLHGYFATERFGGEWFHVTVEDFDEALATLFDTVTGGF